MFVKAKGLQICKTILQKSVGAWGCLKLEEKIYLVSHCHVKKIAVKFVIFFFINKLFFILFYFIVIVFCLYTKLKIYEDSCFSVS